tara:strand:+ start:6254 stop:9817 length:3564 start_codon:yes stop_codon:yes gene_type:complete
MIEKFMNHPYYILAPDFTTTSAGVQVLYELCIRLNEIGLDAYIVGSKVTIDHQIAPIISDDVILKRRKEGKCPIAVYPEIVSGNPLNANVCVRYMLNKEGVISGSKMAASESDLFFFYSEQFMEGQSDSGEKLKIPVIDTNIFCPPEDDNRFRKLLYLNRFPVDKVDFESLPSDIEVLSMSQPLSHPELAKKFQEALVIYSYEYSTTCTMAMLCGCPLVVKGYESGNRYGFTEQSLFAYEGLGFAFSDDSESLDKARGGLAQFRENRLRQDEESDLQLKRFVEVTQRAAEKKAHEQTSPLEHWIEGRVPSQVQRQMLTSGLASQSDICIVVMDTQSEGKSLSDFIESYLATKNLLPNLSCFVLTNRANAYQSYDFPDFKIRSLDEVRNAGAVKLVLEESEASWFTIIGPGTTLISDGLLAFALELQSAPDTCFSVYGDELIAGENGISGAMLRPDFNLDMLLSHPSVMARHWFFRKDVFSLFGGFDESINTVFEFDLILRILEQAGFGAFGHVAEPVLFVKPGESWFSVEEGREVALNHLKRRGYHSAAISQGCAPATYNIDYGHVGSPSVSIIVVMKDQLSLLQACVESILDKTDYANYELLIFDNGSQTPEAKAWLKGLEGLGVSNIRVFRGAKTSDRHVAVNQVVGEARGEYLLFLSADIGIVQKDWLNLLLNHAQRPEVGIVGAKLLTKEGRTESGALVAGLTGVSGTTFAGSDANDAGYMNRLQIDQNCCLVSADCMMLEKELFVRLGGFDGLLPDSLAEADFCLRVSQAGRLNIWSPRALVMRLSVSSGEEVKSEVSSGGGVQYSRAIEIVYDRWTPQLAHDPSYNRNLSLSGAGFEVEQRIDLSWQPQKLLDQKTTLVYPADQWGCGHYRIMQPIEAMKAQGVAGGMIAWQWLTVPEMARLEPDACVFQRQITDEAVANMKRARHILKKPVVYELDDYLPNLPLKSAYRKNMPKDILKSLRRSLKHVDRFVVSTHPLAEAFKGIHSDIRVVENRLPVEWWEGLTSKRCQSEKPRVGWAGGIGHTGDLELVEAVVRDLAEEVDWILFGMCPDVLRPYVKEVHEGVGITLYPQKLASMNLDLAIAPLEDNLFNRCKSNLRLLEYGACGFPVVCSDVEPYREHGLPVTRVKNRYKDWVDAIRMHLGDPRESALQGDELKKVVCRDWMLEGESLQQWLDAWTKF